MCSIHTTESQAFVVATCLTTPSFIETTFLYVSPGIYKKSLSDFYKMAKNVKTEISIGDSRDSDAE